MFLALIDWLVALGVGSDVSCSISMNPSTLIVSWMLNPSLDRTKLCRTQPVFTRSMHKSKFALLVYGIFSIYLIICQMHFQHIFEHMTVCSWKSFFYRTKLYRYKVALFWVKKKCLISDKREGHFWIFSSGERLTSWDIQLIILELHIKRTIFKYCNVRFFTRSPYTSI